MIIRILNWLKNNGHFVSRKYRITLLIILIATVLVLFAPITLLIFKITIPTVITGTEFASIISIISGLYFGANLGNKQISKEIVKDSNSKSENVDTSTNSS